MACLAQEAVWVFPCGQSSLLPQVKEKLHAEAISLLKSGRFCDVFDKALVLCQMHDFQDGVLHLYEQGKL